MQAEKAEEEKKAAEALQKAEEARLAAYRAYRRRSYIRTLASIPEEIVHLPIPTSQVEIVHVPSLGIVLPMAPKTRWNHLVVYHAIFPSVTRKIY